MRRTRIVATIGPASASAEILDRLVAAGMDVARLNFSHGSREWHGEVIRRIRDGQARWERPVAIVQDLQGPKLRLGPFEGGRAELETGAAFTLTPRPVPGDAARATLAEPGALATLAPGDDVWMNDGLVQLRVEAVEGGEARCRVLAGGEVGDRRGVSLPGWQPASCLTAKDRDDLRFGVAEGVDYVAVSFVRSGADLGEVRRLLAEQGADLPVIAKVECREAVANLGEIVALADGVMVARGDLGVAVPLEEVPLIQKAVIRQARAARVPTIVATQMLESMVERRRPTRAEVSDVAGAIFDGADALMLSAETATGRHPVEAVAVMARVAERAEQGALGRPAERRRPDEAVGVPRAIADAACQAARDLRARAIVAFTRSGSTARLISQERPEAPIIALTPFPEIARRLALCWGVSSRLVRKVETTDEMIEEVEAALLGDGSARPGDVLVILSGAPMWVTGTTNLLKLHRVGEGR